MLNRKYSQTEGPYVWAHFGQWYLSMSSDWYIFTSTQLKQTLLSFIAPLATTRTISGYVLRVFRLVRWNYLNVTINQARKLVQTANSNSGTVINLLENITKNCGRGIASPMETMHVNKQGRREFHDLCKEPSGGWFWIVGNYFRAELEG